MANLKSIVNLFKLTIQRLKTKGLFWLVKRLFVMLGEQIRTVFFTKNNDNKFIKLYEVDTAELLDVIKNMGSRKIKAGNIQIENTRFCNLRCPGCLLTVETSAGTWSASHMKLEDFKAICDNLPAARNIALFNFGEPTLHPKYREMVDYTKKTGKFDRIVSTSNLTSHSPEYYNELFELGLDHLTISIDSFNPKIVDRLRTRTNIDKLLKNLEHIISFRPSNITIATVISTVNLGDLENLYARLDAMAARSGRMVRTSPMRFNDYFLSDQSHMVVDLGIINTELSRLQEKFINLKIPQILKDKDLMPSEVCKFPWKTLKINVDGEIMLCGSYQKAVVPPEKCGLLKNSSYEEIISSSAMIEFFESYIKKSPDACSGCPHNFPR